MSENACNNSEMSEKEDTNLVRVRSYRNECVSLPMSEI